MRLKFLYFSNQYHMINLNFILTFASFLAFLSNFNHLRH